MVGKLFGAVVSVGWSKVCDGAEGCCIFRAAATSSGDGASATTAVGGVGTSTFLCWLIGTAGFTADGPTFAGKDSVRSVRGGT